MSNYTVRVGETITDVVLNSTGSIANWDLILQANNFTDWVPDLEAGQVIIIPDTVTKDLNALRTLQQYPANNRSVADVYTFIEVIADIITNNWILATGQWNDSAVWIDTKNWIDYI